jgi:hypothetical protein
MNYCASILKLEDLLSRIGCYKKNSMHHFKLIEDKKAVAFTKFCKNCEITYKIDTFKLNYIDMCAWKMDTNFVSISSETVLEVLIININMKN